MDFDYVENLYDALDLRKKNLKGPKLARETHEMDKTFISYIEAYYPDVASHKCFDKFKERILSKKSTKYFNLKSVGLFYNWIHGTEGKTGEYSFLATILGIPYSEKKILTGEVLFLSQYISKRKKVIGEDERKFYCFLNLPAISFLSSTFEWYQMGCSFESDSYKSLKISEINSMSSEVRIHDFNSYQFFLENTVIKENCKRNALLLTRLSYGDVDYLKSIIHKVAIIYKFTNKDSDIVAELELNFHIKNIFTFITFNEIEKVCDLPDSDLIESIGQFMELHYASQVIDLSQRTFDKKYATNRLNDKSVMKILKKTELFSEEDTKRTSIKLTYFIQNFQKFYGIQGNSTAFSLLFGYELYKSYIQSINTKLKRYFEKILKAVTGKDIDLTNRPALISMIDESVSGLPQEFDVLKSFLPSSADSVELQLSKAGQMATIIHHAKDYIYLFVETFFDPKSTPLDVEREKLDLFHKSAIDILDIVFAENFSMTKLLRKIQSFDLENLKFDLDDKHLEQMEHLLQKYGLIECLNEVTRGRLNDEDFSGHLKDLVWSFLSSFKSINVAGEMVENKISKSEFEGVFDNFVTIMRDSIKTEDTDVANFPKEFRNGIKRAFNDISILTEELIKEESKQTA